MDYNYVRMRNSAALGDTNAAERYRKLCEGKKKKAVSRRFDVLIFLLLAVAVILGVYTFLIYKTDEVIQTETMENEEIITPDIVTAPQR